jgi:rapamycin-insensitive companion of mTOR
LQPWKPRRLSQLPFEELAQPVPHLEKEVITAIANLSNNLLTHTASKTLARVKQRHPTLFKSPTLFYRAIHLLCTCRYRSTVRTYVLDQFDIPLDQKSVHAILQAQLQIKRIELPAPVDNVVENGGDDSLPGNSGADGNQRASRR